MPSLIKSIVPRNQVGLVSGYKTWEFANRTQANTQKPSGGRCTITKPVALQFTPLLSSAEW
ncbi:MAG: hypothetical protein EBU26_18545, partial [Verrucomicrobia bacterium]|nr:hypothetical protein [Verrucomicrobiota bacterium]